MTTHPNILLIITDHQAYYRHHRPGELEYLWPRYEHFCAQGARFEQARSVCPLCSPARSSLMTGLYPSKHGLIRNTELPSPDNLIDFCRGQRLYNHYLTQAGYRNAYIGKWHCGHRRLPVDYGMEGWSLTDYGKVYMSEAYHTYAEQRGLGPASARIEHNVDHPEWEGQTLTLHHESPWEFMDGSGVLVGPPESHEEQFVAHLTIQKLKELARGSQPWSLVSSFWGPHQAFYPSEPYASLFQPHQIPEYPSFRDDLTGRPLRYHLHREFNHPGAKRWTEWSTWQQILARAYAQGLQTDAAIGSVLDALEETGQAENTLVIWCADHGDAVASHGGLWDKASTFTEEVARVPLAVRWPARFAGGQVVDRLVSNMDATATLLEAAGIAIPAEMDSRSLLPLCEGGCDTPWPDKLVCEHHGHGEVILQRVIYHDRYKYVAALYDGDELYDLSSDPHEMRNLVDSAEYAGVKAELRRKIIEHIEKTNDRRAAFLALSLKKGF